MIWKINWSDEARKQLRKLSKKQQATLLGFLDERILKAKHPCDFGKALRYNQYGLWRYRVENMRIICQIRENDCVILIVRVGDRKNIYRK